MSTQTPPPPSGPAPWADEPPAGADQQSMFAAPEHEQRPLIRELLTPLVLLAFATYLLINLFLIEIPEATDFPGPRFFPGIIAGLMYVLLALELLRILREHAQRRTQESTAAAQARPGFDWAALAWTVGGFIVFIATLQLLGWILAAAILFWFVARGFGNRMPLRSLVVGLTVSSLAYIGFDMGLGLNLPSGILGGAF